MTVERFLSDRVALHCGDCRDVLATLPENLLDACVTDPPYHLVFIGERFGKPDSKPPNSADNLHQQYNRLSRGFMGKIWDGGDVAFRPDTWRAVYRVLKPGAHLVACGGTRTYHRMACAIEDAGFEIRDTVSWLYGSGFPKSHDVSKGINRAAGAERGEEQPHPTNQCRGGQWCNCMALDPTGRFSPTKHPAMTAPATDAAREWVGWGTALKPACELIVLARKPLSEPTVAANVLRWGTGAINVDGCRVATDPSVDDPRLGGNGDWSTAKMAQSAYGKFEGVRTGSSALGRWPANVVLSVPEDEYELRAFTSPEQKRELFRWLSENS